MRKVNKMPKEVFNDTKHKRAVFQQVFNTDEGRDVITYLDNLYASYNIGFDNTYELYFKLGRQQVIKDIRKILKGETE